MGAECRHLGRPTDEAQLLALGPGLYDAAMSTMALMDMPVIAPLLAALRQLLKPGAPFVFSVMHPCFNTHAVTNVATFRAEAGIFETRYALQIAQYLGLTTARGIALRDQTAVQYYFHRPLSALFAAGFAAGFVFDGLEEPVVPTGPRGPAGTFDWANYAEFPPMLVARLRLLPG